ncbi:hypothetical protein [Halomicrobium salinisoli]|uniref:hypothetical protein n=1 Tax=Halomicrobium salinisoli TaxID=2878391 RepID=UPI001CEFF921|nr:hypothetical protein [Halomicrobium salinisoli]
MSPEYKPPAEGERRQLVVDQLRELTRRVETAERRVTQVENALCAVARETSDVSVSHACNRCEKSLLIVQNGSMRCPRCNYSRSM